ncbi:hypothetical protein CAEBREN_31303 [Caenorhabditis brenneri]|uniref:Uncharacterized protein n=1 Tax=Caenorhabditis brenneri TaxID=135651 RepID=G0P9C8_CAEBE|nr:hypothetical protein CAEBREN_31303 [Caenorhabditis brenneri]
MRKIMSRVSHFIRMIFVNTLEYVQGKTFEKNGF